MDSNSNPSPFPIGWYTTGGELWNCDRTYCFVPYESLPPLDMSIFYGDFQWLSDLEDTIKIERSEDELDKLNRNLALLHVSAQNHSLTLPSTFIKFMASPSLQEKIPSVTACYFDLSEKVITDVGGDNSFLIRFLNDQQSVLAWYLYLTARGEQCILVAMLETSDNPDPKTFDEWVRPTDIYCCAPTFESFLYRFWIENRLWLSLTRKHPLTPDQQQYMNARSKPSK